MRFVLVPFVTIIFMLGFTFPIKNSRQLWTSAPKR